MERVARRRDCGACFIDRFVDVCCPQDSRYIDKQRLVSHFLSGADTEFCASQRAIRFEYVVRLPSA